MNDAGQRTDSKGRRLRSPICVNHSLLLWPVAERNGTCGPPASGSGPYKGSARAATAQRLCWPRPVQHPRLSNIGSIFGTHVDSQFFGRIATQPTPPGTLFLAPAEPAGVFDHGGPTINGEPKKMKHKIPFATLPPTAPIKRWGELQRLQNALAARSPNAPRERFVGKKFVGPITARMSQQSGWGAGTPPSRRVADEQNAVEGNKREVTP